MLVAIAEPILPRPIKATTAFSINTSSAKDKGQPSHKHSGEIPKTITVRDRLPFKSGVKLPYDQVYSKGCNPEASKTKEQMKVLAQENITECARSAEASTLGLFVHYIAPEYFLRYHASTDVSFYVGDMASGIWSELSRK